MDRKKRILFVGEASYLATGFSTYWNEVIKRLYSENLYEIAEFGSYGEDGDSRINSIPWKFYPVAPNKDDTEGQQIYKSNPLNQFGLWRFNAVCLDFKPDIVLSIRDYWMDEFIDKSPFRKNFIWYWMLTIDGIPQRDLWLDIYKRCDGCLTYSKWAWDVMKKDGLKGTNMITVASPGSDLDIFKPPDDKRAHKAKLGIDPNTIIIGCFAKDTPVLMSDLSYKNIQDIQINDMVIDAHGQEQNVTHTHKFNDNKKMLDIEVMGEPNIITLTHDHEILCVPRSKVLRWTCSTGQKVIWNPMSSDYKKENDTKWIPEFIEPNQLQVGDFWAFKIPDKIEDIEYLITSDYAEQSKTGNKIPEKIYLNEAFLKLCGLYLADGHIASSPDCIDHSVLLSINAKDKDLTKNIIKWSQEAFDITPTIENLRTNVCRININNVCVTRMFVKLFGKYSDKKQIPSIFKWLEPKKQLYVVKGWQLGDGCKSGNRNIGISTNLNMILWFRIVLMRNGIVASINKRNMEKAQCFDNAKQQWRLIERISGKRNEQFIYNGCLYSPIKNIENSNYDQEKYDLTVENSHSYVVYCRGVHNTVMRNQKRKLYYDLIEAFSKWVYKAKTKGHVDLVKKTFLYLHTSYPDVGYDIGRAITEFKVANKILMTYMCQTCGTVYPSFFQGEWGICRRCKNKTAHPPNANLSPSREILAEIMKTFDLYVQYSICLGKDEEIQTKNGWKKISEIEIGEEVFTHKGRYKKVLQKFINSNKNNVKEISVHSDYEKLIITDNHPCYAYTKSNLNNKRKDSVRSVLGNMILLNKNIPDPKWIEVKDLKPDDSLVYCIDDNISDIEKIDLKEFTKEKDIILDNYIEVHKGDVYPRYIDINEQFCEFLGLYVADGSSNISCDQIQITYANHEQYNEDLCTNIWNKLSGKNTTISKYIDRKARDSKMCSVLYNKAFNQWCSRKENKKLPDWCLNLPNSKTKAILKGLFVGDGHYSERQKISKYCTISKILADQIKHLLRRNRIDFNVHIDYRDDDKDKKNRQPQYLFEIPGNIISEEFKQNTRSSTHNLYYKNYHIIKIKNIKNSTYNENVYNIEVEDDNSYKSKITVLHNCEGWGMPLTDAMACGVPCMAVRYSAMEDHLVCPTSIPIEVGRYFYESIIETEQRRALPNNDDFVQKLDRFVKFSHEKRQELSEQTREYAIERICVYGQEEKMPKFSWDRTAAIWKNILDKCEIKDSNLTWFNPIPQLIKPNTMQPPDNLDNVQFVNWIIENIWGRPKMINSYFAFEWIRYLNCGFMIQGTQRFNVDRQYIFNHFLNLINNQNRAEEQRVVLLNPNKSEINFTVI